MLEIRNCTFSYSPKNPVIDDFSLKIEQGKVYGLLGSNGVGKTTLLYLIAGLLTPDSGVITLNGVNTRKRLPETLSDIVIVPEEIDLPSMTITQYGRYYGALYPKFSLEDMSRHLVTLGLAEHHRLDKLSMGQKKKAALAFAMACNSKILIMDEPTNGLDIPGKSAFRKFVANEMNEDRTFIISTHQVRDVGQILDHVLIMNNSSVLVNSSVNKIQERLKFTTSPSDSLIQKAYFREDMPGGAKIILNAAEYGESEIDYEMFFEFAVTDPERLRNLLS